VDDASPDGTGELAEQLAARYPGKVTVVHRPGKLGYASAHRQALSMALNHGAATVITMDADLSHDPGRIPALMQALEHCDVVVGSRYVPGGRIEGWGSLPQPRRRALCHAPAHRPARRRLHQRLSCLSRSPPAQGAV